MWPTRNLMKVLKLVNYLLISMGNDQPETPFSLVKPVQCLDKSHQGNKWLLHFYQSYKFTCDHQPSANSSVETTSMFMFDMVPVPANGTRLLARSLVNNSLQTSVPLWMCGDVS